MNEQFFACFYLLWTRTDCRLIMKVKPTLTAVNRWQVCCCVSDGCAMRIRERIEWGPTPKRRRVLSPFSGSQTQLISKVLMSYLLCPSCILSGVSGKMHSVRFIVSPTMVALSHSNHSLLRDISWQLPCAGDTIKGTLFIRYFLGNL
jgi:hypothetical protein